MIFYVYLRVVVYRAMHFLISFMICFSVSCSAASDDDDFVVVAMISWTFAARLTPKHPCESASSGMSWRMYSSRLSHFCSHRLGFGDDDLLLVGVLVLVVVLL